MSRLLITFLSAFFFFVSDISNAAVVMKIKGRSFAFKTKLVKKYSLDQKIFLYDAQDKLVGTGVVKKIKNNVVLAKLESGIVQKSLFVTSSNLSTYSPSQNNKVRMDDEFMNDEFSEEEEDGVVVEDELEDEIQDENTPEDFRKPFYFSLNALVGNETLSLETSSTDVEARRYELQLESVFSLPRSFSLGVPLIISLSDFETQSVSGVSVTDKELRYGLGVNGYYDFLFGSSQMLSLRTGLSYTKGKRTITLDASSINTTEVVRNSSSTKFNTGVIFRMGSFFNLGVIYEKGSIKYDGDTVETNLSSIMGLIGFHF